MLLSTTLGEKVVSKASAETLGTVDGVVIDAGARKITALRLGKGRKAKIVPWDQVVGVDAAVIVEGDDALRDPLDGAEQHYARGDIAVLGALVLSDRGNAQGTIADIEYDDATGTLTSIRIFESLAIDAPRLRSVGTYAWIVAATDDETGGTL